MRAAVHLGLFYRHICRRQAVAPIGAFSAGDTRSGMAISIYSENGGLTSLFSERGRLALLMVHRLCAAMAMLSFSVLRHPLTLPPSPFHQVFTPPLEPANPVTK